MLRLHPVDSSSVEMVGYDDDSRSLFVRFRGSGGVYLYEGVEQATVDELLAADSAGSYVNRIIKPRYKVKAAREPLRCFLVVLEVGVEPTTYRL
jgi:hypothetical protein